MASHIGKLRWRHLALIVALYLVLAVLYGLVTPIYEGPDEVGHVLYVKHIAEGLGIPVQTREYAIAYGFGQEGSQAPLYYVLNAALVRLFGGGRSALADLEGIPPINPFTICGQPEGGYNVARYRHDPYQEAFPYRGAARAVHVMRLFSALLGCITVTAVYIASLQVFPDLEDAALLAAALVALNPQFAFMGGVVNNDNLVNCLTAVAVALTLYCIRCGFTWQRTLMLGLVCGLAPLAKLGGLAALAFAGLGLLVGGMSKSASRQVGKSANRRVGVPHLSFVICHSLLLIGAFLAVAGWWFIRNWMLYGDPTGINMMRSIYGGRNGWPVHLIVPEVLTTFSSYWAAFACELRFPQPVYWFFGLLVMSGVVGWVRGWHAVPRQELRIVGLLALWLGLVIILWVRWNQITYAALGRLFFQANAAIGALLGYGLARVTSRPRWILAGVSAGLGVLSLAGVLLVVRPAFALPARYPASAPLVPAQPLPQAAFGDEIVLSGYEISARSLEPNQTLEVTLFLRASRPITEDYALALQLISPAPGDDTTLINFNTIPGGGNYPTYAWRPGEIIVDRYRLRMPGRVERTQAWQVTAILYRLSDLKRLPITVAGQPSEGGLGLGLVRVGASEQPDVPSEAQLESGPLFGEALRLDGVLLRPEEGRVRVLTWWRAEAHPAGDYTTLVHLYDAEGFLLSTGDAPPMQGAFPTSLWEQGDLIADEYALPWDGRGEYMGLGWYDPVTSERLPISSDPSETVALFPLP